MQSTCHIDVPVYLWNGRHLYTQHTVRYVYILYDMRYCWAVLFSFIFTLMSLLRSRFHFFFFSFFHKMQKRFCVCSLFSLSGSSYGSHFAHAAARCECKFYDCLKDSKFIVPFFFFWKAAAKLQTRKCSLLHHSLYL